MPSNKSGFFCRCWCCFLLVWASGQVLDVAAQQQQEADNVTPPEAPVSFRPSVAIVIGIFSVMFSLTFFLLIYAKFCQSSTFELFGADAAGAGGFFLPQQRFSGIDKGVVDSLPLFRFSALRGAREGLECAVCLSRFDDTGDVLRLLPKCKHAFHADCVDRWLEDHSSCPLCRCKIKVEDVAVFKLSASARFLFSSDRLENSGRDLELFVEREPKDDGVDGRVSSRFSLRSYSWRKASEKSQSEKNVGDRSASVEGGCSGTDATDQFFHKFKHKIIISDVVFNGRWSDVNSSDLLSLNFDMLNLASSKRFLESDPTPVPAAKDGKVAAVDEKVMQIKEEMEKKRLLEMKASSRINRERPNTVASAADDGANSISNALTSSISSGRRSMSEITNLSRFKLVRAAGGDAMVNGSREDKVRRLWLPIARRTVQWFAGRERKSDAQSSSCRAPANV